MLLLLLLLLLLSIVILLSLLLLLSLLKISLCYITNDTIVTSAPTVLINVNIAVPFVNLVININLVAVNVATSCYYFGTC